MRSDQSTPFVLSRQFRPLLWAIASLGTGISLCLTIQFCVDLGGRGFHPIPVLMGIFCESLKLVSIAAGLWLMHSHAWRERITGVLAFAFGIVLITGSIAASMGYLVQKDARSRQDGVLSSGVYEVLTERKKLLQDRLNASSEVSKQYRDLGYLTKSLPHENEAQKLSRELEDVMAQIGRMRSQTEVHHDFFSGLAILIAKDVDRDRIVTGSHESKIAILAERLRSGAYLLIAIILEAGCVLSLHLIALGRSRSLETVKKSVFETRKPVIANNDRDPVPDMIAKPDRIKPVIMIAKRDNGAGDNDRYDLIRQAILRGELKPAYRSVRDTYKLRQQTVTQFFKMLEQDRIVERQGRGFVLREHDRMAGGLV